MTHTIYICPELFFYFISLIFGGWGLGSCLGFWGFGFSFDWLLGLWCGTIMKSTALKLFTAMTILLAQLSNDVRQDAAGSSRPVQLG